MLLRFWCTLEELVHNRISSVVFLNLIMDFKMRVVVIVIVSWREWCYVFIHLSISSWCGYQFHKVFQNSINPILSLMHERVHCFFFTWIMEIANFLQNDGRVRMWWAMYHCFVTLLFSLAKCAFSVIQTLIIYRTRIHGLSGRYTKFRIHTLPFVNAYY